MLAVLDAGRSEIYAGDYERADANPLAKISLDQRASAADPALLKHRERLLTLEEFLAEAKAIPVVTPDAALLELLRAKGLKCEQIDYPDSGVIARIGWQHLQRGQTVSPDELEANYIRRSDAEIFAQPPH